MKIESLFQNFFQGESKIVFFASYDRFNEDFYLKVSKKDTKKKIDDRI